MKKINKYKNPPLQMESIKSIGNDGWRFIPLIKTLKKLPSDKKFKLLDVGGGEQLLKRFLPDNIEYYSLDCMGKQNFVHDLDKFPLPIKDKSFDIIACIETLEHTLYPHRVIKELLRVAKPDALFVLSMPNEYNFYCRLNFMLNKKTGVQEPFMIAEKHLHIQLPRVKDIIKFFSSYLEIEEINHIWYSRTGYSNNFKGKVFLFFDKVITPFSKIFPSLFTRTVVVKGRSKNSL